ncbi:hypothetical protein [Variovorax sp. efr-133-TYG-130]|uniref:BapA/Bap/LapF family prefix-like domain-containing protein n=1 Tax=Variovorax sp. efr-133-TYG-130 TaxID=3040327 RepID=UPI0025576466|nr:hypothetical protein [Variovorax sp. efr-133-TYG-130]
MGVEVIILLYVVFRRSGEGVQQVKGMRGAGADLAMTSISGEIVAVRGFSSAMDGSKSDLVLDEGQDGSWLARLSREQGELAVNYSSIDPIEPLLMPKASDSGAWPWLLGGGLVAGAPAGGGGATASTAAPVRVDSATSLSNQQLVMV